VIAGFQRAIYFIEIFLLEIIDKKYKIVAVVRAQNAYDSRKLF
jgi:hypothetical protein